MPMTVTVDRARRMVVTCAIGVLTCEDLVEARHSLRIDATFDPRFSQYVDLSGLTGIAFLTSMFEEIAAESTFAVGARSAFVATTPFQVSMARMLSALSKRHRQVVEVFSDRAAAERWLIDGGSPAGLHGAPS